MFFFLLEGTTCQAQTTRATCEGFKLTALLCFTYSTRISPDCLPFIGNRYSSMDLGGGRWVSASLLLLCNNSRLTPPLGPFSLPGWEFPNKPDGHIKKHSTILELAEKYGGALIISSYPATVPRADSGAVSIASILD